MAGLQSAQAGMMVTSQNVTGSSVDGYVRRTSNPRINGMSPTSIDLTGTSFAVEGFTRYFDNLLQGQVLSQQSKTTYTQTLVQSVTPLDAMLTDPATSVATALGNFFNAAGSIANEPSNFAYQQSLIGTARQVADRIRGMADVVGQISSNASTALADVLNQANTLTPQLASVNAKIRAAATPGLAYPSADLLDERDRIVAKLQELVGGTTLINEDGTASYLVSGQHLVDRETANSFANATGSVPVRSDMPLTGLRIKVASFDSRSPVLVPIVMTAVQQRDSSGNQRIDENGNTLMLPGQSLLQDGKAGAYVHLLQTFVPTVQKSLDLLAADLVRKVNQVTDKLGRSINPIFGFTSTVSGGAPLTGSSADATGKALLDNLLKPKPVETANVNGSAVSSGGTSVVLSGTTGNIVKGQRLVVDGVDSSAMILSVAKDLVAGTTTITTTPLQVAVSATSVINLYGQTGQADQALTNSVAFNLVAATPNARSGDSIFVNGIDTGAKVINITGKSVMTSIPITTANASDTITFVKANPLEDFSYSTVIEESNPLSSHYRTSVDTQLSQEAFDARLFTVVGTFDVSQFGNMDATASAKLESLREKFSSPLTLITSSIATTVATWKNDNKANEALQKTLNEQKSAITGVNLDEEAANLVKYQQLYNASSKLIQTGRQMFDTLLGMLSS
jgi:flagellar hook-associated protein 1 FlgK